MGNVNKDSNDKQKVSNLEQSGFLNKQTSFVLILVTLWSVRKSQSYFPGSPGVASSVGSYVWIHLFAYIYWLDLLMHKMDWSKKNSLLRGVASIWSVVWMLCIEFKIASFYGSLITFMQYLLSKELARGTISYKWVTGF